MLQWDAWNPIGLNSGEGPIVAYKVYDTITMTLLLTESVTTDTTSLISGLIQNLTPDTAYTFEVRPVREGPGGEGIATRSVPVMTLPVATVQPPKPPMVQTTTSSKLTTEGQSMSYTIMTRKNAKITSVPGGIKVHYFLSLYSVSPKKNSNDNEEGNKR